MNYEYLFERQQNHLLVLNFEFQYQPEVKRDENFNSLDQRNVAKKNHIIFPLGNVN